VQREFFGGAVSHEHLRRERDYGRKTFEHVARLGRFVMQKENRANYAKRN
jgi:hypothetical protein